MTKVCPKCGFIDPYWRNNRFHAEVEVANLSDFKPPESMQDEYFVYHIPSNKKTTNPVIYRLPKVVWEAMGRKWRIGSTYYDSPKYQHKKSFRKNQSKLIDNLAAISDAADRRNNFDDINISPTNQRKPQTPIP